ncbi:uncharacterized protein BP5553_02196 [Venustampulla echinocandica]|uniref:Exonuclease domain-containing protein n=1 Tax=Venustampulla echinocandica TaxID=2656787 RepID=A0A370U372_9HELO|nr:uncharacterized protein BP5553_02196 [Venustampulla echinocandica]RDL42217.1 hypothetical protein BP5553_02196 [Venustampulla echinocandica]
MSLDYSFSFGPSTPPQYSFEEALNDASFMMGHSRSSSHVSMYSQESSPEPVNTGLTTPARSPIRQHGPLLLPKIRPQDQEIHSPPKRARKNALRPSATFKPSHNRSYTNPESISFIPQHDNIPSHTRSMSVLCSPVTFAPSHERRASSESLDGQTLEKYGFPTYRQLPTYVPSATNSQTETFMPQNFYQTHMTPQRTPSPLQHSIVLDDLSLNSLDDGHNTTLMSYLTSPNPAPALVRQLNIHLRDSSAKHFWWDVRQIRPWTSFNPTVISSIPGLDALLRINLPTLTFPTPPRTSLQPDTELELQNIYSSFYATKLNAALSLSLGPRHLMMRSSASKGNTATEPSFISNYTDDTSQLIYGRGLGRVVGLVKSFDRWNTGMRVEGNHRKVEYLRGLSHLHTHMRTHGCRYGFIITEIELVVVRNGGDNVPHFGYLEVQTIQLNAHDSQTSTFEEVEGSFIDAGEENIVPKQPKMTALMALWYLHMLAKDDTLPGQVGWKSEIGAPAEGTRRKCLPKDEWIPEPQLAEKREAKRARGWVWPEESVGRKELGRRGMTGLDIDNDVIIEIFCVITDGNLDVLDEAGWGAVIHQSKETMDKMDEWCTQTHGESGLTAAVLASTTTPEEASSSLLAYITKFVPEPKAALLAGNTVHADKAFLRQGPYKKVHDHLNHRILDVSSLKEATRRWCEPGVLAGAPKKKTLHKAKDDILESIEEARYYKKVIFQKHDN